MTWTGLCRPAGPLRTTSGPGSTTHTVQLTPPSLLVGKKSFLYCIRFCHEGTNCVASVLLVAVTMAKAKTAYFLFTEEHREEVRAALLKELGEDAKVRRRASGRGQLASQAAFAPAGPRGIRCFALRGLPLQVSVAQVAKELGQRWVSRACKPALRHAVRALRMFLCFCAGIPSTLHHAPLHGEQRNARLCMTYMRYWWPL